MEKNKLLVDVEKYTDTLDYVTEINKVEFNELDLSQFFSNCTVEKQDKVSEKLTKLNNYNKIYMLLANEQLRIEFDLELIEFNSDL